MTAWVTVSRASVILGMSERSVRRHIAEGKLESKLEGNRRLVRVEVDNDTSGIFDMTVSDKDALIRWLKNELEEKNKQIEHLQEELRRNRERSDAIIMKLADELEAQRNALNAPQSTRRKKSRPFWRRFGRRDEEQR